MRLKYLKILATLLVFFMLFAFSIKLVYSDELPIKVFKLKYMKAAESVPVIKMFLSKDGKIAPDERLNALIISDYDENLTKVQEYLDKYDTMPPNVMINAKIVSMEELSRSGVLVNWQASNNYWRVGIVGPGSYTLESSLDTSLLVMSGHEGTITIGQNVPYPHWFYIYNSDYGYGIANTVDFYSVDSGIIVTPKVIEETGEIELAVNPFISYEADKDKAGVVRYGNIQTVVRVKSGQSVVLGSAQGEKNNIVSMVLNGSMKQTKQTNFFVVLTATTKK